MPNGPRSSQRLNRITNQIIGKDQSKAAFQSLSRSLKKGQKDSQGFLGKLRDISIVGNIFTRAIRQMAQAVSVGTKTTIEHELGLKRVEFALKRTGQYTKETRAGMIAVADSMQRTTRFSAPMVLEMEQVLLTMGRLGNEQIPETVARLADYVEAYRGGNGAVEITRQFARGIGGAGGDVGEMGLVLDKSLSPLERWKSAMQQLNERFKGAAAVIGQTASGALAIFQNRMSVAIGQIGYAIIATREFRTVLAVILNLFDQWGLGTADLTNNSKKLVSAFDTIFRTVREGILAFLDIAIKAVPAVIHAFGLLIQAGITLVGVFGILLSKLADLKIDMLGIKISFDGMDGALRKAGESLGDVANTASQLIGGPDSWNELGARGLKNINSITQAAAILDEKIFGVRDQNGKVVKEGLFAREGESSILSLNNLFDEQRAKIGDIGEASVEVGNALQKDWHITFTKMQVDALAFSGALQNALVDAFNPDVGGTQAFKDFFANIRNIFVAESTRLSTEPLFSFQATKILEGIGEVQTEVQGPLGALADTLTAPFRGVGEAIGNSILEAQAMGETGKTVANQLQDVFAPLGNLLGAIFSVPLKFIGKLLDATVGFVARMVAEAIGGLLGIQVAEEATKAASVGTSLAAIATVSAATSTAAAGLAAAWAPAATLAAIATLGAALAFGAAVPAVVAANTAIVSGAAKGVATAAQGSIPGAATGGFTVGEGPVNLHPNEVIVPLNDPRAQRALGGGGLGSTFHITVESPVLSGEQDIESVADLIVRRVAEKIQSVSGFGSGGFVS